MSSLLACAWSVNRSSRSCRVCCSSGNSSTTASPNLSVCATTTCTGIDSWLRRFSQASYRNAANSLLPAPAKALSKPCGSVKQSGNSEPSMVRREVPSASSKAALAKITVPSVRTTAIKVASRSKDWKRAWKPLASASSFAVVPATAVRDTGCADKRRNEDFFKRKGQKNSRYCMLLTGKRDSSRLSPAISFWLREMPSLRSATRSR